MINISQKTAIVGLWEKFRNNPHVRAVAMLVKTLYGIVFCGPYLVGSLIGGLGVVLYDTRGRVTLSGIVKFILGYGYSLRVGAVQGLIQCKKRNGEIEEIIKSFPAHYTETFWVLFTLSYASLYVVSYGFNPIMIITPWTSIEQHISWLEWLMT